MGVDVLTDHERRMTVLLDSITARPIDLGAFTGDDSEAQALAFLEWLGCDPRDKGALMLRGFEAGGINGTMYPAVDVAQHEWRKAWRGEPVRPRPGSVEDLLASHVAPVRERDLNGPAGCGQRSGPMAIFPLDQGERSAVLSLLDVVEEIAGALSTDARWVETVQDTFRDHRVELGGDSGASRFRANRVPATEFDTVLVALAKIKAQVTRRHRATNEQQYLLTDLDIIERQVEELIQSIEHPQHPTTAERLLVACEVLDRIAYHKPTGTWPDIVAALEKLAQDALARIGAPS